MGSLCTVILIFIFREALTINNGDFTFTVFSSIKVIEYQIITTVVLNIHRRISTGRHDTSITGAENLSGNHYFTATGRDIIDNDRLIGRIPITRYWDFNVPDISGKFKTGKRLTFFVNKVKVSRTAIEACSYCQINSINATLNQAINVKILGCQSNFTHRQNLRSIGVNCSI